MLDSELKNLSREELLNRLIMQIEENKALRSQLEDMRRQQADSNNVINRAGMIADAVLALQNYYKGSCVSEHSDDNDQINIHPSNERGKEKRNE